MYVVISGLDVQPDDHVDFYGFSRYARELNELMPELEAILPPTDTRFRPDQRYTQDLYSFELINVVYCTQYISFIFSHTIAPSLMLTSCLIPGLLHQAPGGGEGSWGRKKEGWGGGEAEGEEEGDGKERGGAHPEVLQVRSSAFLTFLERNISQLYIYSQPASPCVWTIYSRIIPVMGYLKDTAVMDIQTWYSN